jgi:hypothetical protein
VTQRGLAEPFGHLSELRHDGCARLDAIDVLARLLDDPARRRALSEQGMALVDGRGRSRVATALLGVLAARR